MNKICTSIEQSKKLLELGIDVYTADMYWKNGVSDKYIQCFTPFVSSGTNIDYDYDIPAWSLTALLGLIKDKCGYFEFVYLKRTSDGRANPLEDVYRLSTDVYDVYNKEEVDACVEMILKLKEKDLL